MLATLACSFGVSGTGAFASRSRPMMSSLHVMFDHSYSPSTGCVVGTLGVRGGCSYSVTHESRQDRTHASHILVHESVLVR